MSYLTVYVQLNLVLHLLSHFFSTIVFAEMAKVTGRDTADQPALFMTLNCYTHRWKGSQFY